MNDTIRYQMPDGDDQSGGGQTGGGDGKGGTGGGELVLMMITIIALAFLQVGAIQNTDSEDRFRFVKENYHIQSDSISTLYYSGMEEGLSMDSTLWMRQYMIRSLIYRGNNEFGLRAFNEDVKPFISQSNDKTLRYNVAGLEARLHQLNYLPTADSLFLYAEDIIEAGYDSVKSSVFINHAVLMWNSGHMDKYMSYTDSAYHYALKAGDIRRQRITHLFKSEYHERISYDFAQAIAYREKADQLIPDQGNTQEMQIRLDIRRAVQLRDLEREYEEASKLLDSVRASAMDLGYDALYETANVAFMRSNFLIQEYTKRKKKQTIYIGLSILLFLLAVAWSVYHFRVADDDYSDHWRNRLNSI